LITIENVDSIAAGTHHTCAITTIRTLYCWGRNAEGQLGNGTVNESQNPVAVAAQSAFSAVGIGEGFTCALRTVDKKVLCWGITAEGALGGGQHFQQSVIPREVTGGISFDKLGVGPFHTCAIQTDTITRCWGWNRYGQIGDSSVVNRASPTPVVTSQLFKSISSGGLHTCAISITDTAFCWGYNGNGQLGDGSTSDRQIPVKVWK
jgi:alpha-tubulin suppressor-like RCC1 family protein